MEERREKCIYADDIKTLRDDVGEIKICMKDLKVFIENSETFNEIRKEHYRQKDIAAYQVQQKEKTTRRLSICAVVVSMFSGLLLILSRMKEWI